MKRWSKLQSRLYALMDPAAGFQIHAAKYKIGQYGNEVPRLFITIGKDIVWDYPKDFEITEQFGSPSYPWDREMSRLSDVIEAYIECPKDTLMNRFEQDKWGLTDILRACDKRVGKRRLKEMLRNIDDETLLNIIEKRIGKDCT